MWSHAKRSPLESYSLKVQYLEMDPMLDGRKNSVRQVPPSWLTPFGSWGPLRSLVPLLTPEQIRSIFHAWRLWRCEPERSRRVLRLVTANQLANFDLPAEQRTRVDLDVAACDLYPFGPEAPAKARVLSPRVLGHWLESTQDAREMLRFSNWRGLRLRNARITVNY